MHIPARENPSTKTEQLLSDVLDELRGLRSDLRGDAEQEPESDGGTPSESDQPKSEPVTLTEPAPAKKAPVKKAPAPK